MSSLPTRNDLAKLGQGFTDLKTTHETAIKDIDRMIADLTQKRNAAEREAFVAEVKQKAIRAAVRVMEDNGVI